MTNPSELKGEELLDYYRDAIRAIYGEDEAERIVLTYKDGRYYMSTAHPVTPAWIRARAAELLRRVKEDTNDQAS